MPLNISALAPGPAGTTMLGEGGGIEAAARRGLERQQCEREKVAAREGKVRNDATSDSGTTLASENVKTDNGEPDNDLARTESDLNGKQVYEDASAAHNTPQIHDRSPQSHRQGKWEILKKYFH